MEEKKKNSNEDKGSVEKDNIKEEKKHAKSESHKDKKKHDSKKDEEIKELQEKILRVTAEFENYKKRSKIELENMGKYGAEELVMPLLLVIDNLERAISQKPDTETLDSFYEGVNLIYKQLMEILESQGLEKIEAKGEKFDPSYHQGVMNVVVDDEELVDTVTEEFQTGYLLNKKVIRPTMVKIGTKG